MKTLVVMTVINRTTTSSNVLSPAQLYSSTDFLLNSSQQQQQLNMGGLGVTPKSNQNDNALHNIYQKQVEHLKSPIMDGSALRLLRRNAKLKISACTWKAGPGAVLLQHCGDRWRALAYTSRGLTSSEFNFTQTEKEPLVLWYVCAQVHQYTRVTSFSMAWVKQRSKQLINGCKTKD